MRFNFGRWMRGARHICLALNARYGIPSLYRAALALEEASYELYGRKEGERDHPVHRFSFLVESLYAFWEITGDLRFSQAADAVILASAAFVGLRWEEAREELDRARAILRETRFPRGYEELELLIWQEIQNLQNHAEVSHGYTMAGSN